jgi:hypothetical protein
MEDPSRSSEGITNKDIDILQNMSPLAYQMLVTANLMRRLEEAEAELAKYKEESDAD